MPRADVVTPNRFELAALTGQAVVDLASALAAAAVLRARGPRLVVATGLPLPERPDALAVLAAGQDEAWLVTTPRRPVAFGGTGDAFSALFLGHYLQSGEVAVALERAVAAVYALVEQGCASGAKELPLVALQDQFATPTVRFAAGRFERALRSVAISKPARTGGPPVTIIHRSRLPAFLRGEAPAERDAGPAQLGEAARRAAEGREAAHVEHERVLLLGRGDHQLAAAVALDDPQREAAGRQADARADVEDAARRRRARAARSAGRRSRPAGSRARRTGSCRAGSGPRRCRRSSAIERKVRRPGMRS